jgi:hypothetical protein
MHPEDGARSALTFARREVPEDGRVVAARARTESAVAGKSRTSLEGSKSSELEQVHASG